MSKVKVIQIGGIALAIIAAIYIGISSYKLKGKVLIVPGTVVILDSSILKDSAARFK